MSRYSEFIYGNKIKDFQEKVTNNIKSKAVDAISQKTVEVKSKLFSSENPKPELKESEATTENQLKNIVKTKKNASVTLKNGDAIEDVSPNDAKKALDIYKKTKNIFNSEESFLEALLKQQI